MDKNNLAADRENTAMHRPQPGAEMHYTTATQLTVSIREPPCHTEGL